MKIDPFSKKKKKIGCTTVLSLSLSERLFGVQFEGFVSDDRTGQQKQRVSDTSR